MSFARSAIGRAPVAGIEKPCSAISIHTCVPAHSANFRRKRPNCGRALSKLSYGTLFRGDKVTVRKYAFEPDYTATILERFAKFGKPRSRSPAPRKPKDDFSLNHIEEAILEFVSRLFPEQFRRLDDYVARHGEFIDGPIARFDREIGFYVAYLDYIEPLKRTGLPFCHPVVSVSSKETEVENSFDLALAGKLVLEKSTVVRNGFRLSDQSVSWSSPARTRAARRPSPACSANCTSSPVSACPVPGTAARLFLPDRIFTHFEREENITNLRGKLEDELVRLHESCKIMTPDSVIVLNEIFNSTSLDDQVFLSTRVLQQISSCGRDRRLRHFHRRAIDVEREDGEHGQHRRSRRSGAPHLRDRSQARRWSRLCALAGAKARCDI